MTRNGWLSLCAVLVVVGCNDHRHPKPSPSSVSGDVPPVTPMVVTPNSAIPVDRPASYETPATDEVDLAKLPVEEDYEERAEREINAANARVELEKLRRDIGR